MSKIKFEDGQTLNIKKNFLDGKTLTIWFDASENTYENLYQIAIFTTHWEHFVFIDDDNIEYDQYGFTFFRSLDYSAIKQEFVLKMDNPDPGNLELENLKLASNLERKQAENEELGKIIAQMQTENAKIRAENTQMFQVVSQAKELLQSKKAEIDKLKTKVKVDSNEENKVQNDISDSTEERK